MPPEPTFEQKLAAQAEFISKQADVTAKLAHKLDTLVAAGQVQRVASRADSVDTKRDDDDARDAKLAKMVADAVAAAFKAHHDARRHEADEAPQEECAQEHEGQGEPQPLSSDDDRLRHEDDRRDRHMDDRRHRADALRRQKADEIDLYEAQSQYNEAYSAVEGKKAPLPISGHSALTYRVYAAKPLQKYSEDWKSVDLLHLAKSTPDVFRVAETKIRADCIRIGNDPRELARFNSDGVMQREIRRQDRTGRWISEFVGPVDAPNGCFAPFQMPPMRGRINLDMVKDAYRK
jgi:hypothetical protein